jgi:putative sigma-54 modulation protein
MKQHDVIISGHHLPLTEAIKNMVYQKVEKLFVHEEKIIRLRVELSHNHKNSEKDRYAAKGHIEINGNDIIVNVETEDLYKSIDELVIKLLRSLRRRSRLKKVKQKNIHPVDVPAVIPKAESA